MDFFKVFPFSSSDRRAAAHPEKGLREGA